MKLCELAIPYHRSLNPTLWKADNQLHTEVFSQLLKISQKFISFLNIDKSYIQDVILTGSNCDYNWNSKSDIDLHIIIDFKAFEKASNNKIDVNDLLKHKKELFNHEHKITIYNIPVELYAQDIAEKRRTDESTYSLKHNKWIKFPEKMNRKDIDSVDEKRVNKLYRKLAKQINHIIHGDSQKSVYRMKDKLRQLRSKGIQSDGEFSIENLAFKRLRHKGYIDKLDNFSKKLKGQVLSLK